MFGVTWRAAGTSLFAAFSAAVMLRILDPLVEYMQHPNHWLVESFQVLAGNVILLSVLSAMLMLLIASVGGVGGLGRGQMKRISFAHGVTLSMAITALIHFRFGMKIIELATNEHAGPFSAPAELLEVIVPVVIGIVLAGTWLWVVISPWQQEQRRREQQRRVVGP